MSKVSAAVEEVKELIDVLTDPKIMTLDEYDEFLDELGSEVDARIDCCRDEKVDDNV